MLYSSSKHVKNHPKKTRSPPLFSPSAQGFNRDMEPFCQGRFVENDDSSQIIATSHRFRSWEPRKSPTISGKPRWRWHYLARLNERIVIRDMWWKSLRRFFFPGHPGIPPDKEWCNLSNSFETQLGGIHHLDFAGLKWMVLRSVSMILESVIQYVSA